MSTIFDFLPLWRSGIGLDRLFDLLDQAVRSGSVENYRRIFDDFARSTGWPSGWPHIEVAETDDDVKILAELPGLEEKDIEVALHNGILTLKGEKKSESWGAADSERWYGRFERSMQIGPDVDPDKITAALKNGVLRITVAKWPEAQRLSKRIPISEG
jgi:HSP20 family protein